MRITPPPLGRDSGKAWCTSSPVGRAPCSANPPIVEQGRHLGPSRHKPQGPQFKPQRTVTLSQNLTLTVPEDSFQTLPAPSLSQQVFGHRWKISTLKSQESREGFRKVRAWAGCHCPQVTRWTLDSLSSPPASSPSGKQNKGSRHHCGLGRQVGQRQREEP